MIASYLHRIALGLLLGGCFAASATAQLLPPEPPSESLPEVAPTESGESAEVLAGAAAQATDDESPLPVPATYSGDLFDSGDSSRSDYYGYSDTLVGDSGCDECIDAGWLDHPGALGWYADIESLFLHRNRARPVALAHNQVQILVGGQPVAIGVPVLGTSAVMYEAEPGVNLTVGHYLGSDMIGRDHFLEVTYFTVDQWNESAQVQGDRIALQQQVGVAGNLLSDFGVFAPGFSTADFHSFNDVSEVNNVELNYRLRRRPRRDRLVASPDSVWIRQCTPDDTPSLLFGLRYVSFDNVFHWRSTGIFDDLQTNTLSPFSGDYDIRATNDHLTLQVGGDFTHQTCRWSTSLRAKLGLGPNWSSQRSRIDVVDTSRLHAGNPPNSGAFEAESTAIGFSGTLGFAASYRINPVLTAKVSYDLLWVTGLALAPEQIDYRTNAPPTINHGGDITLQGVSAGLEARW